MSQRPINYLKEAIELAKEASKEKERFWEMYPYGNAYTIVYGYVALIHRGTPRSRELDNVGIMMDEMTFRREVIYAYLPRRFQKLKPSKEFNELIAVALNGGLKRDEQVLLPIQMQDDEIFVRVVDMCPDKWDDRFVKWPDRLTQFLQKPEIRNHYSLGPFELKPKEEEEEENRQEAAPTNNGVKLNPPAGWKSSSTKFKFAVLPPDKPSDVSEDIEEDINLTKDDFKTTAALVQRIRQELSEIIYGQDKSISKFAEGLFHVLMKSDDRKAGGPKGVFFFAGAPGVGKTYLAENAARLLKLPYKRFNMSEYASETDYFQLTGADPSYRNGHEGLLSRFITRNPNAVLIFDEIEKAGPRVHNIFLQILGSGEFDDDYTKETINCRNTIIIFTSNAGKDLYENRSGDLSEIPENVVISAIANENHPTEKRKLLNGALCSRLASECLVFFNKIDSDALLKIVGQGFDKACRKFENKTSIRVRFDERLPLLFMFHYSNNLDARFAALKSGPFIEKELYELSRQIGNKPSLFDKTEEIFFEVSLPEEDDIKGFFVNPERVTFISICDDEMQRLFPEESQAYTIDFRQDIDEDFDDKDGAYAIFIDPYLGCDTNVWHPLGLDDYDCTGMNAFRKIVDSKVNIPVFLLDTKGHISPTDRESLLQMGAKGFINLDTDETALSIERLSQVLYIQSQCRQLSARGYILDYDTAIEEADEGKKLIVSYYDMWKTQAMDETTGQVALTDDERPDVKLSDVVGANAAKEELAYYVEYLKEPLRFIKKGGAFPKGLLLYGPPGTGKTMLARALAGETECSFFEVSASDLLSAYEGESSDRIKTLFFRARKYAPSVIFIDEIDAIGKERSIVSSSSAVNSLLTEMDGFNVILDRPVFVLAATNYGAMDDSSLRLDSALLRRFDNKIYVGLPKKADRLEYLTRLVNKKQLAVSEDGIKTLADRTTGQSLDMLNHVCDLAYRISVRSGQSVSDKLIMEALDEFLYGEKKEHRPEYYERTALHEAGHAYVAWMGGITPSFISIVSRGNFGGYTALGGLEDKTEYTRDELIYLIRTSLAGRIAEQEFYADELAINTGASSDLKNATQRALDYICLYGMNEGELVSVDIKALANTSEYGKYLAKANEILMKESEATAKIIHDGKKSISKLAKALSDSSYLKENEIIEILES